MSPDDGGPDVWRPIIRTGCEGGYSYVDLLFVVDTSNDMAEQQRALAEALPTFLRAITTGDVDGDGTAEHRGVDSLQTGVVTADMGALGNLVTTCEGSPSGDDGLLRTDGNTRIPGCLATYPQYLMWRTGDDLDQYRSSVACVAVADAGGCGFEQPLESLLKAITPATSELRFFGDTVGHGGEANGHFVRRDGVLAIVLLTSEDDCSASDPDLFDPDSTRYTDDLNLRCATYPDAVHPVSRYVDGLLALDGPSVLVVTAIAGVPTDLVADPDTIDYDTVLADLRMQVVVDPYAPSPRTRPSCMVPEHGQSYPPRRIVSVARDLEARGAMTLVQSTCQTDLTEPVRAIADRIGDAVDACWR